MAYTSPRTWTTNEIVTAAIMNTHVRDNLLILGGTGGKVGIVRLFSEFSGNILDSAALAANTWGGNPGFKNFTIGSAASTIAIVVNGNIRAGNTTGSAADIGARVGLDNTGGGTWALGGGWLPASGYTNALAGAGATFLTGIPAGARNMYIEFKSSVATTLFLRPDINDLTRLTYQVIEFP